MDYAWFLLPIRSSIALTLTDPIVLWVWELSGSGVPVVNPRWGENEWKSKWGAWLKVSGGNWVGQQISMNPIEVRIGLWQVEPVREAKWQY